MPHKYCTTLRSHLIPAHHFLHKLHGIRWVGSLVLPHKSWLGGSSSPPDTSQATLWFTSANGPRLQGSSWRQKLQAGASFNNSRSKPACWEVVCCSRLTHGGPRRNRHRGCHGRRRVAPLGGLTTVWRVGWRTWGSEPPFALKHIPPGPTAVRRAACRTWESEPPFALKYIPSGFTTVRRAGCRTWRRQREQPAVD